MAALTITNVDINAKTLTYTFNPQIEAFQAQILNTTTQQFVGNSFTIGYETQTINYVSTLGAASNSISVGDGLIIVAPSTGGPGQLYTNTVYVVSAPPAPAPAGPTAGAVTITNIDASGLITYNSTYTGSGIFLNITGMTLDKSNFSITSGTNQTFNYATTFLLQPALNDYGSSLKTLQMIYPVPGSAAILVSNAFPLPQGPAPAPAPVAVPCVCAGTMIRTAAGERAVETLAAGDLILTADGREVAIKGIYTTEIVSCSGRNAPYVIQAGAFGYSLPSADLTISPGHALMVRPGQWMIPCHTTDPKLRSKMSRYANGQQVAYYHVELPNYLQDTFIANGVVSESYGINWAKGYKGPSVYTQAANGLFTRISSPQTRKQLALRMTANPKKN
jgi:hypothetical protein